MKGNIRMWALLCFTALQSGAVGIGWAAAPQVKTQAPGFYRVMLGDFEITALNDCVIDYPVSTIKGASAEQIASGLSEMRLKSPVGMSYNAYLINTGRKLVLVDTGTGGKLSDDPGFHGCGHVLSNLSAAGYEPSQVDEIYISHAGPDHVGGLTLSAGGRAFPNATVRAASAEVDVYVDPEKGADALAQATDKVQAKAWFDLQYALYYPYIKAGSFQTFQGDVTLTPGIRALATPGHTPGHTSYVVESRGQTLIVIGDLVHWGAVQFRYPRAYTVFDADPKRSIEARLQVFKMAAEGQDWIAGAHLPFPGIGHVRAGEGRYYWIPVNYAIPQP